MEYTFQAISTYEVKVDDINYGGHMGNERALVIFQDARLKCLKILQCSEKKIGNDSGIILTEAFVKYHKEVFMDDILTVDIIIRDFTKISFIMNYEVRRTMDNALVISGNTRLIAFNYESRKITAIPESFLIILKSKGQKYMSE